MTSGIKLCSQDIMSFDYPVHVKSGIAEEIHDA
jgi:hypothetical protein